MVKMQAFTKNMDDNSTEAGFQFTFFCDICESGYKSEFIPSKTYKKGGLMRGLGKAMNVGAQLGAGIASYKGLDNISSAASNIGVQLPRLQTYFPNVFKACLQHGTKNMKQPSIWQ